MWERNLTSHFNRQGLPLDEAMIRVGLMTQSELQNLSNSTGATANLSKFDGWLPKMKGAFTAQGITGKGFHQEVLDATETLWNYHLDPVKKKFSNYSLQRVIGGVETSDHSIH